MIKHLRKIFVSFLATIMTLSSLWLKPIPVLSLNDNEENKGDVEVTRGPVGFIIKEPTIWSATNELVSNTKELVLYADARRRIKFNPRDEREIDRWLAVSQAMKELKNSDPETYAALEATGFKNPPPEIAAQFGLSRNPLPEFSKDLLSGIFSLVISPDILPEGAGGDWLEVSRLLADYDSDKKALSREGEEKTQKIMERTISSHFEENVEAADLAAFDYILCTKLTIQQDQTNSQLKIKEREKLPAIPIEFSWQAKDQRKAGLSGNAAGGGGLRPSTLSGLFGANIADLFRRIVRDTLLSELSRVLGEAGFSLNLDDLLIAQDWSVGTTELSDLYDRLGQALLRDNLGSSLGGGPLRLGGSLAETLDRTGAAILAESFPGMPAEVIGGESITAWAENLARASLGEQLVDAGFRIIGDTGAEIARNLGLQYFTAKVLNLAPTTALGAMNIKSPAALRASLGRIAASQKIGLPISELDGSSVWRDQAQLADSRLNLLPGTTARFGSGQLSADQYFELVGQAVLDTSLSAYATDPQIRMVATGLAITFGPEDVWLPAAGAHPTTASELAELATFYQARMSAADWQFFSTHYKSPRFTDLDEENEIRTYLAQHMTDPTDLLSPIFAGQATDATWQAIGLRVLAKIDPKPIGQLGILTYLSTGTMPTVAVGDGRGRAPIADVDAMAADRLGLLPGDFERLRTDRFTTEVLPRLAADLFMETIGQSSANPQSLGGQSLLINPSDGFLLSTLDKLATTAQNLKGLSTEGAAARDSFVALARSITTADFSPTKTESREVRIRAVVDRIGTSFLALRRYLGTTDVRLLSRHLASLVAGRPLPNLETLETPNIAVNRSLGLTSATIKRLFSGEISPDQLRRELGAAYIANYLTNPDDPETFTRDLLAAAKAGTSAAINQFLADYRAVFTDAATLFEEAIDLSGSGGLTGEQFFGLMTGNRLPLFGRVGALIHESITGLPGSLFDGGGSSFLAATGLKQLFDAAGWVGNFDSLGRDLANLPQLFFEQSTGLSWATNPMDFLRANGASLLTMLGAPPDLARQFSRIYSSENPTAALEILAKQEIWNQIPIEQTFRNVFGADIGAGMAGALRDMFLHGTSPDVILASIRNNPDRFIGDLAGALGVPFDTTPLIKAIQTGNTTALTNQLISLGSSYLDSRLGALANILTSNDHSPQTLLNFATTTFPQFFGSPEVAALANLGIALNDYFAGGQKNPEALYAAAGAFGATLGIPYLADAVRIFSDPVGFGTAYAASAITQQLNNAFGGGYINYETVRNALFGPGPETYARIAASVQADIDAMSSQLSDSERKQLFERELNSRIGKLQSQAREQLLFSTIDAVAGLPPGFTDTMLHGTDMARLDALLAGASKFGNLPPELNLAIDLIKSGGDITQISETTFGLLDQQLSGLIGVPLPAGFTKGLANVIAGKQSFDQFATSMSDFAIGQVSGMLDQKLGLPIGTSYALYQGFSQLSTLNAQLASLNGDLLRNIGNDVAFDEIASQIRDVKAKIGQLQGSLAGLAISLIGGREISQLERSLNLPVGTVSFFLNAGLGSLFGGGSFIGLIGAAAPWFAGAMLLGKLIGGFGLGSIGGVFGGGTQKVTLCSPGGFYPYWRPEDEKKAGTSQEQIETMVFDPNQNLDEWKPEKRLKPEEVEKKLDLWPGYPGEFLGEETNQESFAWGKQAAARWKIREVTGNLLLLPQRTQKEEMLPNQLILYEIPEGDRGQDGDYLRYYDGRETKDKRFIYQNQDGETLGIVDWPFPWDKDYPGPGYGTGKPNSGNALHPASEQQRRYSAYNIGLWVENAEEYRHHIHYGG